MTENCLILHNPRCSKSRQTLELLHSHGLEPEIREYLKDPPDVALLAAACAGLGVAPTAIVRSKEALFGELGLRLDDTRSDADWLRILAEHPKLIERPIVRCGEHWALGRPPENVLAILPG